MGRCAENGKRGGLWYIENERYLYPHKFLRAA